MIGLPLDGVNTSARGGDAFATFQSEGIERAIEEAGAAARTKNIAVGVDFDMTVGLE